ncbi:MAG: hypothetical protein HF978_12630 [Desulfobacteraceae bacterium]|nr:hypothetical protein [Desulfobacteraceae bacterium]MBC2756384.1 hypothetical protein [Desulfobacteraceae bacterium]
MNGIMFEAHPAVCAKKESLTFKNPIPAGVLQQKIDTFLLELTSSLQNDGCKLIGHIKGMLGIEGNDHLFFSLTSFDEKIRYKGELSGTVEKTELTINVIVYGIEQTKIACHLDEGLDKHFSVQQLI